MRTAKIVTLGIFWRLFSKTFGGTDSSRLICIDHLEKNNIHAKHDEVKQVLDPRQVMLSYESLGGTGPEVLSTNASRLAEEFIFWSSYEFGTLTLDDGFAMGTSWDSQKRKFRPYFPRPDLAKKHFALIPPG